MAVVQVTESRAVSAERAQALRVALRELGLVEFLSEADREQLRVVSQKYASELTHEDAVWLAGKISEVCGKAEPVEKSVLREDGVNPAAK